MGTNKQTLLEKYFEKLFKFFTVFYIFMRFKIEIYISLLCKNCFELSFLAKRPLTLVLIKNQTSKTTIRYTKIEHVRLPLYYTIRTYTHLYDLFE